MIKSWLSSHVILIALLIPILIIFLTVSSLLARAFEPIPDFSNDLMYSKPEPDYLTAELPSPAPKTLDDVYAKLDEILDQLKLTTP